MRVTSPLSLALLALLLVPSAQMEREGRGRGLRGVRRGLKRDRGSKRYSRAGPSRVVATADCSLTTESRSVFLDCQERLLTSVPASDAWSQEPDHLLLARNRIRVLHDGAFAGFESLRSLDLQQNQISTVAEGAFQGLTRLRTLLLQHNRLGTLSEEAVIPMPNLRYLRLYDNPWECHCALDSLVRTLQVPSNRNLGSHARCSEPARLSGVKLRELDPELLCQAAQLHITNHTQSDQTGDHTDFLGSLLPSPIRSKPDATVSCHTYLFPTPRLDCRNKGLTEVPAGIPDDIVHMDLSQNSIHHLRPRDFQEARSLRTLNLRGNNLEQIDKGSLSGLLHLREMDLSDNGLHFIQYGVLEDLYFLSQLRLGGNPWVCDYSIHYMVYWLHLHPGVTYSGLSCRSPPEFLGESVGEYVHAYNRECPKQRGQTDRGQTDRSETDPELWNTAMEVQREEEEVEPSHQRTAKKNKYEIIRLS